MARNQDQYTIQINADATRAKKEIADLLKSLKAVGTMNLDKLGLDTQIREASVAADELAIHLKNATNVNTGKLNLVEFNKSIEASGRSMSQLITTLAQGGNVGQQAFRQLTAAIANTQVPIKQTNTLLNNMMTTLKNTVKWELSSAAVHSLESALSGAVSYVEDLNTSLTNIRIVTNKSAEDMAQFAIQANKAAKELSSTTKAYADASLIYFQQGDTEEMAAKKAAITLKAAHSSFNSTASEMSEYLTAVWNSYKVSGDELQRYVDIMAALGANTATSLEEIATSMQKVAATANTVGVSMEQVSSIIATVSSVTRESAESIGTSYKTIFARIGDLKLGKTDEDGVGLGTVSSQLQAIGVDILDQNQNLREMGDIITDLGNRWQTMTSAQKTATAQAVAGKRQYTQLMALFDNWDMYGKNLATAMNSEGTLEQMNSMYEEGLKAAQDRSRASMETLYSSLIDEKVLTKFANATATIADNIANVVNALGGLGGVAKTVGGLLLSVFSKKIGSQIKEIGQGIAGFVTGNSTYKQQYLKTFEQTKNGLASQGSPTEAIKQTQNMLSLKQELLKVEDSLTTKQAEYMQSAISSYGEQISELNQLEQEYLDIERTIKNLSSVMQTFGNKTEISQGKNFEVSLMEKIKSIPNYLNLIGDGNGNNAFHDGSYITDSIKRITQFKNIQSIGEEINSYIGQIKPAKGQNIELTTAQINALTEKINLLKQQTQGTPMAGMFDGFSEASLKAKNGLQNLQSEINETITKSQTGATALVDIFYDILNSMSDGSAKDTLTKTFISILDNADRSGEALKAFKTKVGLTDEQLKELKKTMENMNTPFNSFTNALSKALGTITSSISSYRMLSSAIKNVSSGSGDLVSNIGSIAMSASMLIPVLSNILDLTKGLGAASPWIAGLTVAAIAIKSIFDGLEQGKIEKKTNEQKDNYDKIINGQSEEFSKTSELIKNYQTLSAQYESTESSQEDLIKSAMELADAYGLVSEKVKIARGDFSTFNESLYAARKNELQRRKNELTTAQTQIEQSVNNGGTYYDISGKTTYDSYISQYRETLSPDQIIKIIEGESDRISLRGTSKFDNAAINKFGIDRRSDIFRDLFTTFMTDEYQSILRKKYNDSESSSNELAIKAIEEFIRIAIGSNDFSFDRKNVYPNWVEVDSGMPFKGYRNLEGQFVDIFKDKGNVKISDIYKQFDDSFITTPISSILESFGIDDKFINELGIIDEISGTIKWNGLDFSEKLKLYKQYKEDIIPAIQEKQTEISQKMKEAKDKDSNEYKALEEYSKYLNGILSDISQITGPDSIIAKAFEEYLSNDAEANMIIALENNQEIIDKYSLEDRSLSGFFKLRDTLYGQIKSDQVKYTGLEGLNEEELDQAINDIIRTVFKSAGFEDYFNIDQLIREIAPEDTAIKEDIMEYLGDKGIKSVEEINSALLTVISNWVGDASKDAADAIIAAGQEQIETSQAEKDYSDAIKAQKLFKSDMSQADRQKFVEYFFKDSTTEEINAFIGKSFDERDQWIAEIVKTKQNNMLDQLKAQYEQDKMAYEQMTALATSELANLTSDSNLSNDDIKTILDGYVYDEEQGAFVSKADKDTVYSDLSDKQVESLRRYQEYVASQEQLENQMILSYGEWQMQQLAIDDTLSSLEKLQKVQQKLSVDFTNLPKKGTLAWRQLATQIGKYNGKYLGQMNNESEQIQAIAKATTSNIDEQINELIIKRNSAQTEREKTEIQSQIDQLIQERERVIREADQAIVNLAISPIIAEAEQTIKKLQEQADKAQSKANALIAGINQKYLTYEQQASIKNANDGEFDYSNWLNSDNKEKVKQAINALTDSFQKQQDVILKSKQAYMELQDIQFDSISDLKDKFKDDESLDKAIEEGIFGEGLSPEAKLKLQGIRQQVYSLIKDGASSADISAIINEIITDAIDSGDDELALLLGKYKDQISGAFDSLSEEQKQLADNAVSNWESAFSRIAELRRKMLSGEDIASEIFGSSTLDDLWQKFLDSGYGDYKSFSDDVRSGKYDETKLQMPKFDYEKWAQSRGLDVFSQLDPTGNIDITKDNLIEQYVAKVKENTPQLNEESDADYATRIAQESEKQTRDAIKTMLTAYGKPANSEYDIDKVISAFMSDNQDATFKNARGELVTAFEFINEVVDDLAEFGSQGTLDMDWQRQILEAQSAATGAYDKTIKTEQETVNGYTGNQDQLTKLQDALSRAVEEKYKKDGAFENLSEADRAILKEFGIESFDQVDTAATDCASALAALSQAASTAARDAVSGIADKLGLTKDEKSGLYYYDKEMTKPVEEINKLLKQYQEQADADSYNVGDVKSKIDNYKAQRYGFDSAEDWKKATVNVQEMATSNKDLADSLATDAEAAREVAKEISRYNMSVEAITKNYKEWSKALKGTDIEAQRKAMKDLDKVYADMLDLDYDILPDSFLRSAENLDLMQKAAKGSQKAYDELQSNATKALYDQLNGIEKIPEEISSMIDEISKIDSIDVGEKITVGENDVADKLAVLYDNAVMAVLQGGNSVTNAMQQANELMNSIGFNPPEVEMEEKEVTVTGQLPDGWDPQPGGTVTTVDASGKSVTVQGVKIIKEEGGTYTYTQTMLVPKATKFTKSAERVGGSSGKSSGGGGGSKQKETKKHKRYQDEIERYHKNNETLSRVSEQLDKIEKQKERVYGAKYIDRIDEETEALKRQLEAQQALYDEANKYIAADKVDVARYGATFDQDGTIVNYEEVMRNIIDEYNRAIDVYNNSDQEEGAKKALEAAEERYNDAVKSIENYEEAIQKANEAENNMLETRNKLSAAEVEKITYKLEFKLEMNDRDLALLEYYQDKYAEQLDKQDDLFASYFDAAAEYEQNLNAIGEAYNSLVSKYAAGLITEKDYAEQLEELHNKALDNLKSLNEVEENLIDSYTQALELAQEQVEKTTSSIESANETLQSYMDILNLYEGTTDYKKMANFYDMMNKNNITNIEVQKKHLDVLLAEEDKFQEKIRNGQELTELEKKEYEALEEQIQDTRETLLSTTQEALETIRSTYENTINGIADDLDNFMAGSAGSLSYLQEQYEQFQEEQEQYVSTTKELYEVSKLNRDIEGSIADATSKASKEALKALQEKINKQSELNQLTEYDLQMNQLEYQLLLARINLEETKNAKDVVRLTRDDNGNYAYRYTANQDKIDEAAQKYEDVLQQINELTVNRISDTEQKLVNAMANYKEKFVEIATDYTLTEEERLMKLEELTNNFSKNMQYIQEQNQIATDNLATNQEMIADYYGASMSEITSSTAGNVNDNIQSMMNKTQEYVEYMNNAIYGKDGWQTAWKEYIAGLGNIKESSGQAYEDMMNNAQEMGEMNDFSAEQAENVLNVLEDTLEPLTNLTEAWNAHNAILNSTIETYENLAQVIQGTLAAIGQIPNTVGAGDAKTTIDGKAYARGGLVDYTGLAWVDGTPDDPELMLNAGDTQNILAAASVASSLDKGILRTLMESVSTTAQAMLGMLSNAYHAIGINPVSSTTIDQQVHITAEFPNVTDHNEIEEALSTLVNRAAQFANHK